MTKYKIITDRINTFFTNNKMTVGNTAPTTGSYTAGDIVISTSANATAFGWICTVSGTPGTWKVLKSGADVTSIAWSGVSNKPATYTPTIGTTSTTSFRGDYGNIAYNHSQQAHAPSNAQKNSDITKAEIEAKLTGAITTHTHNYLPLSGGTVTGSFTANNIITAKAMVTLNNAKRIFMKNKDGVDTGIMTLNTANNFHIGYGPYDNGETEGTTYLSGATGITFRTVNGNIRFYPNKTNVVSVTPTALAIGSKSNTAYMCLDVSRKCDTNTTTDYAGSTARIGVVNSLGGCSALEYREGDTTLSYFRVYKDCVMFNGKRIIISTGTPSGTRTTGDIWFDI